MCTIVTANRETFDAHTSDFVDRIQDDAKYNGHGFSLILAGKRADEVSVMRALNVELVVAALLGSDWERFWFHSRYATGAVRGLSGCHAFQARHKGTDWYVMHNGVLRHDETKHFNVDSEWIASLINRYGVDSALSTISNNESFANCFVVAPAEGKWHMLRLISGSLYASGDGECYSTNKIEGVITETVPDNKWLVHTQKMELAPYITRGSVYGNGETYSRHDYGSRSEDTNPKRLPASDTTMKAGSTNTTNTTGHGSVRTIGTKQPNDFTLGILANLDSSSQLGRNWIRTGRGVWVRQQGDVVYFNGREPDDKRKKAQGVH